MPVDANGLEIPTLEEITDGFEARQRAEIDPAIDTSPGTPLGQLNRIYAESEEQGYDELKSAYDAFDPDKATGFALDAVCALTGVVRLKASRSEVTASVNLNAGTTLIAGQHAAHVAGFPDRRFTPKANFTAPTTGFHSVVFVSEELGPIPAPAGSLIVIATPVAGWNSITHPADAKLGRNEETDAELRERRVTLLERPGSRTVGAIRSEVLAVAGVKSVTVFENDTDEQSREGLPPHSIEVLLFDGETPAASNDAIGAALLEVAEGIRTVGSTSVVVTDELGGTRTVKFTRATVRPVFIDITVVPIPPFDATTLKNAIVAAREEHTLPGKDVVATAIICDVIDLPYVADVTVLLLGFAIDPTLGNNLSIGTREVATFHASRIVVTEG